MTNDLTRKPILFIAGVALGLAAMLGYAWGLLPVNVVGDPANLNPDSKEAYILLTSMTYVQTGDLAKAQARLALLNDPNIQGTVRSLAERYVATLRPEDQRSSLSRLALALGADSVTLRVYAISPTPTQTSTASPTSLFSPALVASRTSTPTSTPRTATPTAAPTSTPLPRVNYRLFEQVRVSCDQDKAARPHLVIFVQDANGKGLPGLKVRVQWSDGQDTFFTGLKGTDPGYADYDIMPGKSYSVVVMDGTSQVASGLDADALNGDCPGDGKDHFRSWRVIFRRMG
jgi:hypothetical protein